MRYEHEGKIAVLYSPRYGAGWSTWNDDHHAEILMMHPVLVEPVHQFEQGLITKEQMKEKIVFRLAMLGLDDVYTNGAIDLTIFWLDPGQRFRIEEHDGNESVVLFEQMEWLTA
jgi:hypothetical protein